MKEYCLRVIKNILSNKKIILALIFLLALGLRLGIVFNLSEEMQQPVSDAIQWDNMAKGLLEGKGLVNKFGNPSSYRMPLYPGFLATIYYLFENDWQAVRVAQSFLGAFLTIIMYLLSRVFLKRTTSFFVAFITAIYAPFIMYSYFGGPAFLLSEGLFMFLLAVSVLFLAYASYRKSSFLNIFLAGLFLGLATMTRPSSASLTAVYLGFFYYKNQDLPVKMILKKIMPFVIAMAILFIPWTIRNYKIQGAFIPLNTHDGVVFYCGNNSTAKGSWGRAGMRATDAEYERCGGYSTLSDLEIRTINYDMAFADLKENPQRIPGLLTRKVLVFWSPFNENERYNLAYGIIAMFAFIGALVWRFQKKQGLSLILWIFACFTFGAIIFFGDPRFRYPIEPYLVILSAFGMAWLWSRPRIALGRLSAFAIVALNCLIYLYWGNVLLGIKAILKLLHLG